MRPSRIKTTKDAYDDGFSVGSDGSGMSAGGWPYQSDFDKPDEFVRAWLRGFSDGRSDKLGQFRPSWANNPKRKTMAKRRKYKRTARRGGRVMTVTTSSRVVKTTRMNPHGISLEPYKRQFPVDRGRYRVSISSSHSSKQIRKFMRELFPGWTKEQHADRYFRLWHELHYAKGLWGRFADRAHAESFPGKKRGFLDYKVSGVGRDEYPERIKTRLRAAARAESVIQSAIHAHELMVDQKTLKRVAKKYPIGHNWRSNPRPSKTHIEFVIQGNYGYGWDDENTELTREDAKRSLREYRENGQGSYRLIRRRVKNDATNPRTAVRVTTASGNHWITEINGSLEDAKAYFLGKHFNTGTGGRDRMEKVVKVEWVKNNPHDPRTADTVRIPAVIRASIPAGNGSDPRRAETRRLRVVRVAAARSNPGPTAKEAALLKTVQDDYVRAQRAYDERRHNADARVLRKTAVKARIRLRGWWRAINHKYKLGLFKNPQLALKLSRATWRRLPKGDRRARGSVRFVRCKTSKRGAAHWLRCVVR